jgi:hypothetical protein
MAMDDETPSSSTSTSTSTSTSIHPRDYDEYDDIVVSAMEFVKMNGDARMYDELRLLGGKNCLSFALDLLIHLGSATTSSSVDDCGIMMWSMTLPRMNWNSIPIGKTKSGESKS